MIASFLGTNAFAVTNDRTAEFSPGVRVLADCGADGARYGTVAAALYAADVDRTTVTLTLDGNGLTGNLAAVLHGNDIPASLANHGHTGPADGGAVAHGVLSGIGTNSHAAIDAFLASKAAASGLASLDAASRVVQDPANATATPGATKIVMSDAAGTVDAWVSDATASGAGKVRLASAAEAQAGVDGATAVTPAGLAGAAKGLIAADTTLHVATTGNDATGDGSSNAPFASIARALSSIRNKLIASGVTVTIQVADGTYLVSTPITIDHPDADKIQVLGNTSAETTVEISAIDTAAKTINVEGDYTASILAGDIIALTGSSTSGLNGAYTVSSVSSDGMNTIITCAEETIASAIVGGGSIVIKPCNRCRLECSGYVFDIVSSVYRVFGLSILCTGSNNAISVSSQGVIDLEYMIFVNSNIALYGTMGPKLKIGRSIFKACIYGVFMDGGCYLQTIETNVFDGCTQGVTASASNAYCPSSKTLFRNTTIPFSPLANTTGNINSFIAN